MCVITTRKLVNSGFDNFFWNGVITNLARSVEASDFIRVVSTVGKGLECSNLALGHARTKHIRPQVSINRRKLHRTHNLLNSNLHCPARKILLNLAVGSQRVSGLFNQWFSILTNIGRNHSLNSCFGKTRKLALAWVLYFAVLSLYSFYNVSRVHYN